MCRLQPTAGAGAAYESSPLNGVALDRTKPASAETSGEGGRQLDKKLFVEASRERVWYGMMT